MDGHFANDGSDSGSFGRTPTVARGGTSTVAPGFAAARAKLPRNPAFERGDTLGRYIVIEPLGEGGMGVVYAAYDPRLDRKVALKLLRSRAKDGQRQVRLLREARALARLNDPRVITVYDVGTFEDRVFLAMEFVPGTNVAEWLRQSEPSREQILDVFLRAGGGLAAAHDAGLVHRDFKPGNVMVRDDRHVLVLDFGLARSERPDEGNDSTIVDVDQLIQAEETPSTPFEERVTATGAALGTPAFMAPEQWRGQPTSPATDQFSFCASLYLALYRELPYRDNAKSLASGVLGAPEESTVPPWIRRILLRGLSVRAEDRYPSMHALLRDLGSPPGRRRRQIALGIGAVLAVLLTIYLVRGDGSALCSGAEEQFATVWNRQRAEGLEQALVGTDRPFAGSVADAARAAIDRYGESWVTMHTETCQATRLRGEQSAELMDRRMACLRQERQGLDSLVRLLESEPDQTVENAVQAIAALPSLARCADARALMAPIAPPADASGKERVAELRRDLAAARAARNAGRLEPSAELIERTAVQAEDLGYWPLTAETLLELGRLQERRAEPEAAESTLRRALLVAEAGRHDRVAAEAFVRLVRVAGYQRADLEQGAFYAELGRTLISQLDQGFDLEAELADHMGLLAFRRGEPDEALTHLRRALELKESTLGAEHPAVARSLIRLSNVRHGQGDFSQAAALLERALVINERAFGPEHPVVAFNLERLGVQAFELADYTRASELYERALAIQIAVHPEDPKVATTLTHLGTVLSTLGDHSLALNHYHRALEIYLETFGPEHPHVASTLTNLGSTLHADGRFDEALERYAEALAIQQKAHGTDHPWAASTIYNIGVVSNDRGDFAEAAEQHRQALRIWTRAYDSEHPLRAHALTGLGIARIGLGRPEQALEPLRRALEIWKDGQRDPGYPGEARFHLARALLLSGGDPQEALASGLAAREELSRAAPSHRPTLEKLDAWLAEQGALR